MRHVGGHSYRRVFAGLLATLVCCTAAGTLLGAKVKFFTLVEKTRMADAIFIGQVTTLRNDSVAVRVQTVVKGMPPANLELDWDRAGSVELPPAAHAVGDQILAFVAGSGSRYRPVAGAQGTLKLQPGWAEQYEAVIRQIVRFDSAADADARTSVLLQMMNGDNRLSHASALEIVYMEYHTNTFSRTPLLTPVMRLAQQPERAVATAAIQVLSRLAEREQIAPLIQLMATADPAVARTALRVLKDLTGADFPFDPRATRDARAAAARRWAEWWNANKDTVVLVK